MRSPIDEADAERLTDAMRALDSARSTLRRSVQLAAENGASVRALAEFTGMSTNTISRWKTEPRP